MARALSSSSPPHRNPVGILRRSFRLFDFQFNLLAQKGRHEFIYDEYDGENQ